MSDQALDAAEERRRRRELRQKRILENSGQRLGKILGSPPDASESLAESSIGDGAEVARRAPAFDGANPSAYLAANQEVLQADPAQILQHTWLLIKKFCKPTLLLPPMGVEICSTCC